MKVVFHYYKEIQRFNIPISMLGAALTSMVAGFSLDVFLSALFFSLLSGGYVLSLFVFELMYKEQYYFYFNKGFSKIAVIGYAFLLNLGGFLLFSFARNLLFL